MDIILIQKGLVDNFAVMVNVCINIMKYHYIYNNVVYVMILNYVSENP